MTPRIETYQGPTLPSNEKQNTSLSATANPSLYSGLGVGQIFSLPQELALPRQIASHASHIKASLPRIGGGMISILSMGYDLFHAYKQDRYQNDPSLRETRRQLTTSALSLSAGFGVGSVAGLATAGVLIAGAPVAFGAGIAIAGSIGAIAASSYTYDWAQERVKEWIR